MQRPNQQTRGKIRELPARNRKVSPVTGGLSKPRTRNPNASGDTACEHNRPVHRKGTVEGDAVVVPRLPRTYRTLGLAPGTLPLKIKLRRDCRT